MIKGISHKFGANIDTDAIIPSRYANLTVPAELGQHCMEGIDPGFSKEVRPGDIIVADANFGCGSSREVAPISIKGAQVACVVARSFARIFFRNAINIALPVLECPAAVDNTAPGDELQIDLAAGMIRNVTRNQVFTAAPYPGFLRGIIEAGGLIAFTRQNLAER
jgi:3-isopropylmalate/(R)-2-methylmalate dehydratase small subunit